MTQATTGRRWAQGWEGLIEAAWLAAIVITALFFNHLSYRSFEPDKAGLLRSLALIAALAWVLRSLAGPLVGGMPKRGVLMPAADQGRWPSRLFRVPLLLPALALWLSMALSTWLSVDWQVSLLGSYERGQGLYTASAYLVLFIAVLTLLRSRQQFDRLVTTLIIASIPVAVLGLMQYQGIDPIRWSDTGNTPVVSTMGNTIFVAAWLVMIVPLLLHRLASSLAAANRTLPTVAAPIASAIAVGLIGMLLVTWPRSLATAVAISLAGLVLLLSFGWVFRARLLVWLQVWGYTVVLAAVIACILLTERRGPFLGLLTGVFLFVLLRMAIIRRWRAVLGMIGAAVLALLALISAPSLAPSLLEDTPFERLTRVLETGGSAGVRLHIWQGVVDLISSDPLRSIVGYGPDTLHLVVTPFSPPEIVGDKTGLADRSHSETLEILAGRGFLGLIAYVVFVTSLVMLGLRSAGLIRGARARRRFLIAGGLGALVFAVAVRVLDDSWRLLAIGLPAALLFAIFVENLARFSREPGRRRQIAAGTQAMDRQRWAATLCSALVAHLVEAHVGIATVAIQTAFWILVAMLVSVAYRPARFERIAPGGRRSLSSANLLTALVILTLAFNFPLRHFAETHSASILWLFGLIAVLAGVILLSDIWNDSTPGARRSGRIADLGIYTSVVLLTFSVAGFVFSWSAARDLPLMTPLWAYLAIGTALLIALALSLASDSDVTGVSGGRCWIQFIGAGLLTVVVVAIVPLHLRPLHADSLFKRGLMGHHRHGRYEEATHWYRRAIALAPGQDHYHLHLGMALAAQAERQRDAVRRDELYRDAVAEIGIAQRQRPLHPIYPESLARLYLEWGSAVEEPDASTERLHRAVRAIEEALGRNPNRPELWILWGDAHSALGEYGPASAKYRQAISLGGDSPGARTALARSLQQQGRPDAARQMFEQIIEHWPDTGIAHAGLIQLHLQRSDCVSARTALSKASGILPDDPAVRQTGREVADACPR